MSSHTKKEAIDMEPKTIDRITTEPDKLGGKPCIRGLRISVLDVLGYLTSGMSEQEILDEFPDCEHEDFIAVCQNAARGGLKAGRIKILINEMFPPGSGAARRFTAQLGLVQHSKRWSGVGVSDVSYVIGNHCWFCYILLERAYRQRCTMPTRNVNLTDELDRFVSAKIESGRYENASEVVRAALRALERDEQQHEAKLAALRAAIEEGDASGVSDAAVRTCPPGIETYKKEEALTTGGEIRLSRRAEADLIEIATYTLETWGEDQAVDISVILRALASA